MDNMMTKKFIILLVFVMLSSGCTKGSHWKRLMTLKSLAKEQDDIGHYVAAQDKQFEKLRDTVKAGEVFSYASQEAIQKNFGEPVLTRTIEKDGKIVQEWLYRYATQYINVDKIYLTFDTKGQLIDCEYVPPGETRREAL